MGEGLAGLIEEMVNILSAQHEILNDLVELSKEKTEYIIKNNIEALQRVTGVENVMSSKLQRLDRKREVLNKDIAIVLGQNSEELSLNKLTELMEGQNEYSALSELENKLAISMKELKSLNEQNKRLIFNSLEYIDFNINAIRSTFTPQPVQYAKDGKAVDNEQRQAFFDAKQ